MSDTEPTTDAEGDLLYEAWGIIANAGWDGSARTDGWQDAAIRWRGKFHAYLDERKANR